MKTKQPLKAERELDSAEWNFSSVDKSDIETCYTYEYARALTERSPRLRNLFAQWLVGRNARKKTPQFLAGLKAYKEFRKMMTACFADFPLINNDWFPDIPWQKLDKEVQCQLVKEVNSGPQHYWESLPSHKLNIETFKFEKKVTEGWTYVPEPFREEDISHTERGSFAINWHYSDAQLTRAFAEWLPKQRKAFEELHSTLTGTKYKRTGRGGFWDRLNWLGALRQKTHYRKSQLVDRADIYRDKLKTGASFYSQYRDLREAAKKARRLLDVLLSRVGRI